MRLRLAACCGRQRGSRFAATAASASASASARALQLGNLALRRESKSGCSGVSRASMSAELRLRSRQLFLRASSGRVPPVASSAVGRLAVGTRSGRQRALHDQPAIAVAVERLEHRLNLHLQVLHRLKVRGRPATAARPA